MHLRGDRPLPWSHKFKATNIDGPLGDRTLSPPPSQRYLVLLNLNSEIETADSADFTDFEGVIGDVRANLFVAKLQDIDNRNLLYP